jgi:hypothetical protein
MILPVSWELRGCVNRAGGIVKHGEAKKCGNLEMAEKTREPSPSERSEALTRHRPKKAALHDLHCANYVCRAIVPEAAISLRKNFSAGSRNAMDT